MNIKYKVLSVVMPAYNEEANIYDNIGKVVEAVKRFEQNFEIIVVNDGSTDRTKSKILQAARTWEEVTLVSYKKNRGKGNAIREGVKAATGTYIAFLDSDLDLPPEQLEVYLGCLQRNEADVVIGSKMHKDSEINYPAIRKMMSFGYFCMLKLLFKLNVKDTQTGIKMFKAEALKSVIGKIKTRGFAYDIEILAALNCKKYRIIEMPVKLNFTRENRMGRIKFSDIFTVFKDTWAIFFRAKVKKYYGYDRSIESKKSEK